MTTIANLDMRDYLGTRPSPLVGRFVVRSDTLREDYARWARENKRDPSKAEIIGRSLKAFYPRVQPVQLRVNGQRKRFYRNQTPFLAPELDDTDDLL